MRMNGERRDLDYVLQTEVVTLGVCFGVFGGLPRFSRFGESKLRSTLGFSVVGNYLGHASLHKCFCRCQKIRLGFNFIFAFPSAQCSKAFYVAVCRAVQTSEVQASVYLAK